VQGVLAYLKRHHVGLLALVLAMSGTAYAAVTLDRGSVKTKHIAKGAVTPKKLSEKAREGAEGPRGRRGATGPTGLAGQDAPPLDDVHLIAPAPPSPGDNCLKTPVTDQFCGERVTPTYGSWGNYGAGYSPAGYFKDRSGLVHLQGGVTRVGGAAPGFTIFILPAGYRPSTHRLFAVYAGDDSTVGPDFAYVQVYTNGRVVLLDEDPNGADFLQLDGIQFRP